MPNPTNHQNDRPSQSVQSEKRNISFRRNEPGRPSSPLRPCCISPPYRHQRKSESIMTTGRYPCLMPPGTVTPKLTGQIQQPPESDRSSARTGILSSLLFSRSSKPVAHALTWSSPRMMTSMHRPSDSYCLHGAKNESITIPGPAQPHAKILVQQTHTSVATAHPMLVRLRPHGAAMSTRGRTDHCCRRRILA